MGKRGVNKLQTFCVNRVRPVLKAPLQNKSKSPNNFVKKNEEDSANKLVNNETEKINKVIIGRKIMVVVDSSMEARVALQWTLTHTLQAHDSILLLYVIKVVIKQGKKEWEKNVSSSINQKVYEQLYSMKKTCLSKWPQVEVEIKIIEGKEKGQRIVEEARKEQVSLLVLGQKKRSTTWQLLLMWAGNKGPNNGSRLVEYCIQNATCMALAVRKNSKKVGGYLITTKRQKDFWLLA